MRQVLVGLLVLPCVIGGAATLRMPTAAARVDEVAARSGGVHAAGRLARWMTGRFEAEARHTDHGTVPAVSMRSCKVEMPALGERVLYIERAFRGADGMTGRPFEQRLVAIEPAGLHGQVRVREFTLVDPVSVRGLCDHPTAVPAVATVEEGTGCALRMRAMGHALRGATEGDKCPSAVNGARYATRTLEVTDEGITMDDQGFDNEGRAAWGGHGAQLFARADAEE